MVEQIKEAWQTNNKMNILLIDSLDENQLEARPVSKREGRTVRQQLIHLCNVRYAWLEIGAKEYAGKLKKINKNDLLTTAKLKKAFIETGGCIENFLLDACKGNAKLKGFKAGPVTFMGYLIAHDAHHRGQILLALKQSGLMVDKKVQFGIWEWWK